MWRRSSSLEEIEAVSPEDSTLARLLPQFTYTVPIRTDPAGASVYIQSMEGPEDEWDYLGVTPLQGVRFAGFAFETEVLGATYGEDHPYRLSFELDGHRRRELLLTAVLGVGFSDIPAMDPVALRAVDADLDGMVRISGFTRDGIEYDDYYLDRYEVTNEAFKEFVDAGGYSEVGHWVHSFVRGGVELSFEEAMAFFKDQTGRPGPSTWRLGTFAEGQGDYPVGGVSWHEAAAYANWTGKALPTTAQWAGGRRYYRENSHVIVPRSNLGADGPRPVGRNRSMTTLGVYDLVGNVREWCYNEAAGGGRATRGGAWNDPPFNVGWIIPKPEFDRDATHGFRLVRAFNDDEALAALRYPVQRTVTRDYWAEQPASDAEFAIYKRFYDYDPTPLNPVVEQIDSSQHWIRQRVAFDLPYGERGGLALYLPKTEARPFQAVVYWGGSGLMNMRSIDEEFLPGFDFLIRSGRAVAVPIFSGAYGRPDPRLETAWGSSGRSGAGQNVYRDLYVHWVTDLRTSIDYLDTRADIDIEELGYFGFSFGGNTAPVVLAVEPRIDAAVLNVGGLGWARNLPEIDPFDFVPRVRTPILMINGEFDIVFPYETAQRPMFERLGTDPADKRHYRSQSAHMVHQDELITETLNWFDRYLGVPGGG
jgi:dienelactone hydrolase